MKIRLTLLLALWSPLACTGGDSDGRDSRPAGEPAAVQPTVESLATTPPDTTAGAVWAFLESAAYSDRWTLWPDQGELYPGSDPHGMLLTTYLNEVAFGALEAQLGTMPVGAILVKENYRPDSVLAATTVMVKQTAGYNPEHNDWWFLKRNADGSIDAEGRGAGCQSCHGDVADNDYIFTGSLGG